MPIRTPPRKTKSRWQIRMTNDSNTLKAALRQRIVTDRLLGISSLPIPRDVLGRIRSAFAPKRGGANPEEKATRLKLLDDGHVKNCTRCTLSDTRTQTVFGQGNPAARLVFVGEAPGFEEDKQGLAFVGRAGQLLTRMIVAMGLSRDDVFICNVLKCRPPGNRDPSADEILACRGYLSRQLEIIEPEILVALGSPAAKTLLNTALSIGKLRGEFHDYFLSGVPGEGPSIPLMPTYHPAYLLRNPAEKGKVWEDLQAVMARLGLKPQKKTPSR